MLLLAATVAAGSCTVQSGSPPTPPPTRAGQPALPVTGRLLAADGRPLAAAVRLDENRGIASDVFGTIALLFTLGLSCLGGADPCRPSGGAATTSGADGTFRFDTTAVQQARARSNGVILSAGSESAGGLRVKLNPTAGGDLGDLSLWAPRVQARVDGGDVRFTAVAPPGADRRTEVTARILDAKQRLVGQTARTGPEVAYQVDRRAYEDGPGTVVVTAGFSRPRAGQNPRIDWTSPPVGVGPGAGAPVSRGRPCTLDRGGAPAPAGCPLTDGDLVTDAAPGLRSAVVDLGAPRPIGLVAVRPSAGEVEVSTDGQVYEPVGRSTARPDAWPAALFDAGSRPARFVRVATTAPSATPATTAPASSGRAPSGPGIVEVSVWPSDARLPSQPATAPRPSADPSAPPGTTIPLAAPLVGPDDDRTSGGFLLPALVALVLLLVVVAATGVLAGRRR